MQRGADAEHELRAERPLMLEYKPTPLLHLSPLLPTLPLPYVMHLPAAASLVPQLPRSYPYATTAAPMDAQPLSGSKRPLFDFDVAAPVPSKAARCDPYLHGLQSNALRKRVAAELAETACPAAKRVHLAQEQQHMFGSYGAMPMGY